MKIALVHDYLAQDGGAERVLHAFHRLWPDAPIFVLFHDPKQIPQFADADIRESFIARLPFGRTRYHWYLPLMPLATEQHDFSGYDVVLSSTSAFAKGIITSPDTVHVSYCHTPTRYLWSDTHEYVAELKYPVFIKWKIPFLMHYLRMWDRLSSDRVDQFIANSSTVAQRISKYYHRESTIVYPPAEVDAFTPRTDIGNYFLAGGRITASKRFDLIVDAFNRLGLPLKIFGTGPRWWNDLKSRAKPNIEFLGRVSEEEKIHLMEHAQAFIHPQVEDFGITPVESMAAGRPVIAYGKGGVTETIIDGKTGVFFHEQTWESLYQAVRDFDPMEWNGQELHKHAAQFSEMAFAAQIKEIVEQAHHKKTFV